MIGKPCSRDDLDIAAKTVAGESRSEPFAGQCAVAWTIINRVRMDIWGDNKPDWWGEGVSGVCLKSHQYSCWLMDDRNRKFLDALGPHREEYVIAMYVFTGCWIGKISDQTNGATHYHHKDIKPTWSIGHTPSLILGRHLFYGNLEPGTVMLA